MVTQNFFLDLDTNIWWRLNTYKTCEADECQRQESIMVIWDKYESFKNTLMFKQPVKL